MVLDSDESSPTPEPSTSAGSDLPSLCSDELVAKAPDARLDNIECLGLSMGLDEIELNDGVHDVPWHDLEDSQPQFEDLGSSTSGKLFEHPVYELTSGKLSSTATLGLAVGDDLKDTQVVEIEPKPMWSNWKNEHNLVSLPAPQSSDLSGSGLSSAGLVAPLEGFDLAYADTLVQPDFGFLPAMPFAEVLGGNAPSQPGAGLLGQPPTGWFDVEALDVRFPGSSPCADPTHLAFMETQVVNPLPPTELALRPEVFDVADSDQEFYTPTELDVSEEEPVEPSCPTSTREKARLRGRVGVKQAVVICW